MEDNEAAAWIPELELGPAPGEDFKQALFLSQESIIS